MIPIPKDKLPEFFFDKSRRNVLYAPLRSKTVNPNDWDFKISSWKKLISLYCISNKVYCFSLESLKIAFQDDGRTPKCLDEVLSNMLQNKEIQLYTVFSEKKTKTWTEWAKRSLISSPITWSFNKMSNFFASPDPDKIEYVPLTIVYQEADALHSELLIYHKNEVLSLGELLKERQVEAMKQKDLEILLICLYNINKLDMLEISNSFCRSENLLIKVCDPNNYKPISEVDLGIRTLKVNEKTLEKNIEFLTESAKKCKDEAKNYLVKGQRQLAKASLKKKQEIEKRIDKKADTLYNIHTLWNKLQDASLTGEVLDSYKKALQMFEATHQKGVDTDAIDDTMLKVAEMLELHDEIESTLGRPVIDNIDEDLEKELEELLENNKSDDNKGSPSKDSDESIIKALENLELNLPSLPTSPASVGNPNLSTQIN